MHAYLEHELRDELLRLVRLPALGGPRGALARRSPSLVLRGVARQHRTVGIAHLEDRHIEMVVGPATSHGELLATLAHELVHFACERHDRAFRHTLSQLAYEAWAIDVTHAAGGRYAVLDRALEEALVWPGRRLAARVLGRRLLAGLASAVEALREVSSSSTFLPELGREAQVRLPERPPGRRCKALARF